MAGGAIGDDWAVAGGSDPGADPGSDGVGVPVAPMVGDVGDDQVVFLTEQLTRALSERSSRSGGRTVVVVPIDQRTLDAGRAALGDSLEKEMALWVARAVAGWKVREDRKAGLIDVHGKRAT
jgi:hypothetical protein